MTNTYIQLITTGDTGTSGYIYLTEDIPVSLTFSVAEIQDISKKNASYSKTISIPGNKNNNKLFGNIFNINSTDWTFDINRKQLCLVVSDGIPILRGYLQLLSVKKLSPTSIQGEEQIFYECLIFDNRVNFYDILGSQLLEDLDLSQNNHIYNNQNVLASSANTYENYYKYPMYYGPSDLYYQTQDFLPSIFLKTYIDKIFEANSYSYESNFFESEPFTKLLIPYNGDIPKVNQDDLDLRKFQASITAATTYTQTQNAGSAGYSTNTLSSVLSLPTPFNPTADIGVILPFNDDSTNGNFDSGGTFNTSTSRWTSATIGTFDLKVAFGGTVTWSTPVDGYLAQNNQAQPEQNPLQYYCIIVKNPDDIVTFADFAASVLYSTSGETAITAPQRASGATDGPDILSASTYSYPFTFDIEQTGIQLSAGDVVEARFYINNGSLVNTYYDSGNPIYWLPVPNVSRKIATSVQLTFDTATIGPANRIANYPWPNALANGDGIYLNNFIPKQIQQKDLFSSLVTLFNLFIEQDPDNERRLKIKTREEYYSGNTYVDWTHKLALDKDIDIKFLAELQNKRLNFSWKEDKDVYNANYKANTGLDYGQFKVEFDNDFLQGEKKIETIFSPTPLQRNGFNLIVSAIDSAAPKNNIRLLYDGGMREGTWIYKGDYGVQETREYYLYAGHFDDPLTPNVDLNWSECEFYYYPLEQSTTNNLYQAYWENYVDQIANGKMLTAYFDLNQHDIANLNFANKVFVQDSFYYINKIIDFDVVKPTLTKVELIKIDEGLQNRARRTSKPSIPLGQANQDIALPYGNTGGSGTGTATGVLDVKGRNDVQTDNSGVVVGNENFVSTSTNKFFITGDGNQIINSKSAALINSDNNNLLIGANKNALINSDFNTVYDGAKNNVLIGVSGQTITGSNLVYIADLIISGDTFISGGPTSGNLFSSSTGSNSIIANNSTGNLASGNYSAVLAGTGHTASGRNTVVLGGAGITGSANDTVYVPDLRVQLTKGIYIATGTNATCGTVVLTAGTATVSTNKVTASSIIQLTHQVNSGTVGVPYVRTRTAGTSFQINSTSGTDTSTIGWIIIEPY